MTYFITNKLLAKKLLTKILITLFIIMVNCSLNVSFGQRTIQGNITDEENAPLPGVNIHVKDDASKGTISGVEGEYRIEVSEEDSVLVFTYVGYLTEEVNIIDKTEVDVQLVLDIQTLEDVVVVGYGSQRKKDITGSISVADDEILAKSESNTLTSRLQGLVPGVQVSNTGEPGSIGDVRIRGNVFTGLSEGEGANNPLYVIDGVLTSDNRFLNPNDIESVQVLKDASSSSIYGSRAANGVIIITTKRGMGDRPTVRFNSSMGWEQIPGELDIKMADNAEWARIHKGMLGEKADPWASDLFDPNRYTDWKDVMLKTATARDLNLSVSGGWENGNVYFSVNNTRQEGTVGDPFFERTNIRLNSEFKLGKKLTIGENITVGRTSLSDPEGSLYAAYSMFPVIPVYDTTHASGYGYGSSTTANTHASNPKALEELITNKTNGNHFLGNAFLRYEILDGLEYELSTSFDIELAHRKQYEEQGQISPINTLSSGLIEDESESYSYFIKNKLQYNKSIGDHSFSIMGSYVGQLEKNRIHATAVSGGYTFEGKNYWVLDASTADPKNYTHEGNENTYTIESYLGRITYNYADRYLLNFMIRHDGSSRFVKDLRWGTFPSISGGWIVSNENFFSSVPHVNFLKLRAGYGVVGNATEADYVYQSELILTANNGVNYNLGPDDVFVLGATRGKPANPNLKWEQLQELNVGTDLLLFNSRLELIFDYFNGKTTDLIYQRRIPPSNGTEESFITENILGIRRHGWEFSGSFKNEFKQINYKIGANLSYVQSELNKLIDEIPHISDGDEFSTHARSFLNQPVGQFFLLDYDGIYSQEDIDALDENFTAYGITPQAGDAKFIDHGSDPNGEFAGAPDGKINEFDRVSMGNVNPIRYGFSFNARYKAFDLTIFFQGVTKYDVYNSWYHNLNTDDYTNYTADFDPYINGEGTEPRSVFGREYYHERPSSKYLENGAYFRLKNLQIGYHIPLKFIQNLRVYLSGQNLYTWTQYRGLDPEINGPMFGPAVDQQVFPNLRTFIVGLDVTF